MERDSGSVRYLSSLETEIGSGNISGLTKLTDETYIIGAYPKWSPNRNKIAFTGELTGDPSSEGVYIMDTDGSNITPVTIGWGQMSRVAWAPSGDKLVFISNTDDIDPIGDWNVYTINTDGTGLSNLTNCYQILLPNNQRARQDCSVQSHLDWSPDGTTIIFDRAINGVEKLHTIPASGGTPTLLPTDLDSVHSSPRWSPNGNKILFRSRYDLYTVNKDGSNLTRLTVNPENPTSATGDICVNIKGIPTWSEDGAKIAFVGTSYVLTGDGPSTSYQEICVISAIPNSPRISLGLPNKSDVNSPYEYLDW